MDLCREYKWEFLIRYKKGSIPSIAEEYEKIPEKGKTEKAEFVNDIDYDGKPVHVLRYREEKAGETTETFQTRILYRTASSFKWFLFYSRLRNAKIRKK